MWSPWHVYKAQRHPVKLPNSLQVDRLRWSWPFSSSRSFAWLSSPALLAAWLERRECSHLRHTRTPLTRVRACQTIKAETDNDNPPAVTRPYAWNSAGELAFYHTTTHPTISAEWQVRTVHKRSSIDKNNNGPNQTCSPSVWKSSGYSGVCCVISNISLITDSFIKVVFTFLI